MLRFYLDFDGVIAHSAIECINSAFNVWLESNGNNFDELDFEDRTAAKAKIIDYGIANRHLVVPPEHYYCLVDAIASELLGGYQTLSAERIKSIFSSSVESTSSEIMIKFKHDFFSFRNSKFAIQTDAEWVQENPPTPFIGAFFELIENYPNEVLVVSRKNYKAVEKWGVGSKLPIGKIYGNEVLCQFNNNKFELIESLQREGGYLEAFFVDDMISEFESLDWRAIGVTTLAAGWGYNNLADNTQLVLKTIKGHLDDLYH
jgi:hypothetical protein